MSVFNLRIVTPKTVVFDDGVEKIIVRTVEGDVGILKNHASYVSVIKSGPITIFLASGEKKKAILKNGLVSVADGKVEILVFEYRELDDEKQ